ncbi:MAG: c-type cytochrome [Saprospiraceae bacterium]|nr:c-type cytochrome [Saprospiraceae bacterium]
MKPRVLNIFYILIFSLMLFSCDFDRNKRGYEYFPDMAYSEAYETYAPNVIFPDGKTAQAPVPGTIPRHMVPYQYPNSRDGMKLAGVELENPFPITEENVTRGRTVYNVFCANCHGLDGRGDGNLYASGKYPSEPPSLVTEEMLIKPDGEYYHIMTSGSAIMGPFAALIRPEDRWKIILYIKSELSKSDVNTVQ